MSEEPGWHEPEVHWPDSRKSLFRLEGSNPRAPTVCQVHYVSGLLAMDGGFLAQQFKRAADTIVEHLSTGLARGGHPDGLFPPVAYLYRHSLELELKYLVSLAVEAGMADPSEALIRSLGGHQLRPLWGYARAALQRRWPDGSPEDLDNVESLIEDLTLVDRSGQSLRYSHDKNGNPSVTGYPRVIDLCELKQAIEGVHNLLEGCAAAFHEIVDWRSNAD